MSAQAATPAPGTKACVFCGTTNAKMTREHVIPKWGRRSFDIKGPVRVDAREKGPGQRRRVGSMQALNVTLDDAICEECNSVWLSRLERAVKPLLAPMAVSASPATLSPASQKLLATWAVKTVLLLELAFRQMYPARQAEGYQASQPEFAWLRASTEPPPRSLVWLGCWDCQQAIPVGTRPPARRCPHRTTARSRGTSPPSPWDTSRSVFTVDYVAAAAPGFRLERTGTASLAQALPRIRPPLLAQPEVSWPPQAFGAPDWDRLVTWDGALRWGPALAS